MWQWGTSKAQMGWSRILTKIIKYIFTCHTIGWLFTWKHCLCEVHFSLWGLFTKTNYYCPLWSLHELILHSPSKFEETKFLKAKYSCFYNLIPSFWTHTNFQQEYKSFHSEPMLLHVLWFGSITKVTPSQSPNTFFPFCVSKQLIHHVMVLPKCFNLFWWRKLKYWFFFLVVKFIYFAS